MLCSNKPVPMHDLSQVSVQNAAVPFMQPEVRRLHQSLRQFGNSRYHQHPCTDDTMLVTCNCALMPLPSPHAYLPCKIMTSEVPSSGCSPRRWHLCTGAQSQPPCVLLQMHIPGRTRQHACACCSACVAGLVINNLVQRRGIACACFAAFNTALCLA